MFKNVEFEDWASLVAIVAFVVSFVVFLYFVIMAIRMPRKKVQHDSELPLKKENLQ